MAKRCIYCSCELGEDSVVDVCRRCGIGVWGEKMFNAIISNMEKEKDTGNLELGRVGETTKEKTEIEKVMEVSEELAEELEDIGEVRSAEVLLGESKESRDEIVVEQPVPEKDFGFF